MVALLMSQFYRTFWDSKKFDGHTVKVELWHNGAAYVVEKIIGSMIQVCRQELDSNEKLLGQLSSLGLFM